MVEEKEGIKIFVLYDSGYIRLADLAAFLGVHKESIKGYLIEHNAKALIMITHKGYLVDLSELKALALGKQ